jgi:hypothetical protein
VPGEVWLDRSRRARGPTMPEELVDPRRKQLDGHVSHVVRSLQLCLGQPGREDAADRSPTLSRAFECRRVISDLP